MGQVAAKGRGGRWGLRKGVRRGKGECVPFRN